MKGKLPVKYLDTVVILLAVAVTGFSVFTAYVKPENATEVLIQGAEQQWIFPLDAEESIDVQGPLGITVVRIHGNEAWIESSPCENQTCITMGHAKAGGDWVACLPNRVFVTIEGSDDSEKTIDAAAW